MEACHSNTDIICLNGNHLIEKNCDSATTTKNGFNIDTPSRAYEIDVCTNKKKVQVEKLSEKIEKNLGLEFSNKETNVATEVASINQSKLETDQTIKKAKLNEVSSKWRKCISRLLYTPLLGPIQHI